MKILLWHCAVILVLLPPARAEWKSESEAGVIVSSGNSRAQSTSVANSSSHAWEKDTLIFRGSFLQSKSQGVLSAYRWDSSLRYERSLSWLWHIFIGQGIESDRFAGFLQRYNSDLGAKYWIFRKENRFEWTVESGYRYQREHQVSGRWSHSSLLRLYSEANRSWNERVSSKGWVEYLPNLSNGRAWLLNSELSSSFLFHSVFAIKLAYLVKYQNQPISAKNTDTTYTTSLVAKF